MNENINNQYKLQLNIYIDGKIAEMASVAKNDARAIKQLTKKIFVYDTSSMDEIAFKNEIVNYLKNQAYPSVKKMAEQIVYKRNENGKYIKYLYFNERTQKVYLDRDVMKWFILMTKAISTIIQ